MTDVRCPHCSGGHYELRDEAIHGAAFVLTLIRCTGCGAPAGVLENQNVGHLLALQGAQLQELRGMIGDIQAKLNEPPAPKPARKPAAKKAAAK
jgi:hypothetical protein